TLLIGFARSAHGRAARCGHDALVMPATKRASSNLDAAIDSAFADDANQASSNICDHAREPLPLAMRQARLVARPAMGACRSALRQHKKFMEDFTMSHLQRVALAAVSLTALSMATAQAQPAPAPAPPLFSTTKVDG